jgi:hypothetical protein
VHGLRQTYHRLKNHFGQPIEHLCDIGHVESHFGLFGDSVSVGVRLVLGLRQMYLSSEIILDPPDGTPR